jgi:hypothetical protein
MKWYNFTPNKGANRQRLPQEKKYVLVKLKNMSEGFPDPVVVGYLKYHAGVKQEPYFITPGATIKSLNTDDRVSMWCDCLPDDFTFPL